MSPIRRSRSCGDSTSVLDEPFDCELLSPVDAFPGRAAGDESGVAAMRRYDHLDRWRCRRANAVEYRSGEEGVIACADAERRRLDLREVVDRARAAVVIVRVLEPV